MTDMNTQEQNFERYDFSISSNNLGSYCFTQKGGERIFYLNKDGTLNQTYDGNFFSNMIEAAVFLENYLDKRFNIKEVSRAEVAEALGVSLNFELVD